MKSETPTFTPEEELAAWNAWKEICFVDGCPPKQRAYLRRRIFSRINEELQKYNLGAHGDNVISPDEMIIEFDLFLAYKDGLPREAGVTTVQRHHFKQHKDFLWHKLSCSNDPLMQVLNGKLLGPRGVIMDVIRKLIKTHYQVRDERIPRGENGKTVRRLRRFRSLQEPLPGSGSDLYTLEDRLAANQAASDELAAGNIEDVRSALNRLIASLSRAEKLVLLAKLLQINAAAPSLLRALGRGKSTVFVLQKQVQDKIQQWYQGNDDVPKIVTSEAHQIFCDQLMIALQQNSSAEVQNFLCEMRQIRAEVR